MDSWSDAWSADTWRTIAVTTGVLANLALLIVVRLAGGLDDDDWNDDDPLD